MSEVGSVVNGDLPSRRAADAWSRETASTVQRLSDRVSVLERDMAVTNTRLDIIEERIDEIKKGIDTMKTIAITTLLSVIGGASAIIYELIKLKIMLP